VARDEREWAVIELLTDREDLVEAVTDLRWREWGHPPESTDRGWWREATLREAGRNGLPITWVASDSSGVVAVVGLGEFDIEERHDRSPWVLGLVVRPDRRRTGLGGLLLTKLENWASGHGHQQVWVANEGHAVDFYRCCGWQMLETVKRKGRPSVTVLTKRL
jgi:GNAT superfamily N-acetyltransferase